MNTSVLPAPERREVALMSDGQQLMAVISRAATDPSFDIAKMERLLEMHERITARAAEAVFNTAMSAAQSEMGPIAADADNPQTRSKYATYAKIDSRLRPIYTKHGFALSFDEDVSPKADHVRVVCIVSHTGGHTRRYTRDMCADGKGAKGGDVMTKVHASGSAHSYGARYLVKGIFNVAVGEEDDDGNGAGQGTVTPAEPPRITAEQAAELENLLIESKADRAGFLKFCKVDTLEKLPPSKYAGARQALTDRKNRP